MLGCSGGARLPAALRPALEPRRAGAGLGRRPATTRCVVATNRGLWLPDRRPARLARDPQGDLVGPRAA